MLGTNVLVKKFLDDLVEVVILTFFIVNDFFNVHKFGLKGKVHNFALFLEVLFGDWPTSYLFFPALEE